MNKAKFNSIWNGLSSVAKKVYNSVPIQLPWEINGICADLHRQSLNIDKRTVQGCLNTLVDSGLIKEVQQGSYVRVPVKEKNTPLSVSQEPKNSDYESQPDHVSDAGPDLLLQFTRMVDRLGELKKSIEKIISDMEVLALKVDEKLEAVSEEYEDARQLRDLLEKMSNRGK